MFKRFTMDDHAETAQLFAESFCELHEETFHTYMMLATEEYSTTIAELQISNLTCAPNVDYAIKK